MRGHLLTSIALTTLACTPPPSAADRAPSGTLTAADSGPAANPSQAASAVEGTSSSATPPPTAPAPADPEPEELAGLKASLVDAKLGADGISVTFILNNVGSKPVHVFERWNSWGADQWSIELEERSGARTIALNPQQAWTKNYPSAFKIEPGQEHRMRCVILPTEPEFWKPLVDYFVPRRPAAKDGSKERPDLGRAAPPGAAFDAFTRVRGVFDTKDALQRPEQSIGVRAGGTITSNEIWSGRIATPWLSLKP